MKELNYTSVITRHCVFDNMTDKQMTNEINAWSWNIICLSN